MSHIVSIKTEVRDRQAVEAACTRLRWPAPVIGVHRLFTRSAEGLGVQAPRWQYPIVCNLATGELSYDNFEGRWGNPVELDRFKQSYAVEKTKIEARKQGRYVSEQTLAMDLCSSAFSLIAKREVPLEPTYRNKGCAGWKHGSAD